MHFHLRTPRNAWPLWLLVAGGSMACALALTHAFWPALQYTPFLLAFGAATLSSRLAGRKAGFLAVIIGVLGYSWFPPPLPADGFGRLVLAFVIISSAFSWVVARRYEIEAALRSSESRLAEAQQIAHIGSWEWNATDNSEVWSEELYRIFGVSPRSFRPTLQTFMQLLHPDDVQTMAEYIQRASVDHQPFECDYRIIRPDGVMRSLRAQSRVVLDEHGRLARMVGTAQDITDRKAAEETVTRSERRLQTIIDAEPACVQLVAPDGLLLDMNRSGLEMLAVENLAQVVGRPVVDWVHPDDRNKYLEMHRAAVRGSPGRLEFRTIGPTGQERWVDSYAVAFETSNDRGEVQAAVLSVMSDISERVRAQHALHDAEERMRFALEASRLGVWETNLKTGVSYWSETCALLHGLDRGTSSKSIPPFVDCVHPEDRQAVLQALDEAFDDHRNIELEYRTVWPDGTEHRISSTAHFFYDDEGLPVRGAGVSIDVTEKRSLEAQLRQSHKMEAIGLLAGGIAHDFNNVLTAIGGFTELVHRTFEPNDPRRRDLQEVAKATTRAEALTRHLLAVSRRQILEPTVLDLNEMVADIQQLLRRTVRESIDLRLELSPDLDRVRADRSQIEQVLLNLVINAGDAMQAGGLLRIATAAVDVDDSWAHRHQPMPAGRYVRLTVTDTGTGMTQETQRRMFEPFFTTKERGKGTGLGLATVYGIVKQSEGFIWVQSEVGRGTTFEIYLPVVFDVVETRVQLALEADTCGGSQTILLAEDDGAVRRLARNVLSDQGYMVLDARDGDEALAVARRYPRAIHLLVTDVVMPGLSGRDLAERLAGERPGVRVLYTSGYTENVMVRSGFEDDLMLLAKPFLPSDLLRKVREALEPAA
jgi:PAS domain S-box-containing protein